jgi:hypothetical protein
MHRQPSATTALVLSLLLFPFAAHAQAPIPLVPSGAFHVAYSPDLTTDPGTFWYTQPTCDGLGAAGNERRGSSCVSIRRARWRRATPIGSCRTSPRTGASSTSWTSSRAISGSVCRVSLYRMPVVPDLPRRRDRTPSTAKTNSADNQGRSVVDQRRTLTRRERGENRGRLLPGGYPFPRAARLRGSRWTRRFRAAIVRPAACRRSLSPSEDLRHRSDGVTSR